MDRVPVVEESHKAVSRVVREGDFAVDATAGNGRDTALLCQLVGASGFVLSVDIQPAALASARETVGRSGWINRCRFECADHTNLAGLVARYGPNRSASVVMFNLGYLPGGDKSIATRPESTAAALRDAASLIRSGGLVSVVVYRGHPGAIEEAESVEAWLRDLDPAEFRVERSGYDTAAAHRPYLALVYRLI
jgi:predicted methyltransferase